MTPKQIQQFNTMLETLKRIAGKSKQTNYMTTAQLRRGAEKDGFMEFEEIIEMTYENIQGDAWQAVRGVKSQEPKPKDLTLNTLSEISSVKIVRAPVKSEGVPKSRNRPEPPPVEQKDDKQSSDDAYNEMLAFDKSEGEDRVKIVFPENLPVDFVIWYSGMKREQIEKAYKRYLTGN